jgi:hypothetical protein
MFLARSPTTFTAFINQRQRALYSRAFAMMISAIAGRELLVVVSIRDVLAGIATVGDMACAFQDESQCRRVLEAIVWPRGRICPACG